MNVCSICSSYATRECWTLWPCPLQVHRMKETEALRRRVRSGEQPMERCWIGFKSMKLLAAHPFMWQAILISAPFQLACRFPLKCIANRVSRKESSSFLLILSLISLGVAKWGIMSWWILRWKSSRITFFLETLSGDTSNIETMRFSVTPPSKIFRGKLFRKDFSSLGSFRKSKAQISKQSYQLRSINALYNYNSEWISVQITRSNCN